MSIYIVLKFSCPTALRLSAHRFCIYQSGLFKSAKCFSSGKVLRASRYQSHLTLTCFLHRLNCKQCKRQIDIHCEVLVISELVMALLKAGLSQWIHGRDTLENPGRFSCCVQQCQELIFLQPKFGSHRDLLTVRKKLKLPDLISVQDRMSRQGRPPVFPTACHLWNLFVSFPVW